MECAISKLSSKGQIVIPKKLRALFSPGEEFLMMHEEGNIIIQRLKSVSAKLREDLLFAQKIEKAYQEIDAGNYTEMSSKEFLEELKTW